MALQRRDGAEPIRLDPVTRLEQRVARSWHLGTGTLACPRCDAPVALAGGTASPAHPLACPFCDHAGPLREFLSLAAPARPARVDVRVVPRR